jgi:MarR family transcriptional regulator, organic hydroperoxide resistance regulator
MQVTAEGRVSTEAADATRELAADLYALVVYLHKNCNSDLFEAVGTLELSLTQIKLLHHLGDASSELTLKEAAETVHVSLPAASRMVDDLVRRGFVVRNEDAEDRRMKRVRLTDAGGAVIRRLNAARLSGFESFAQTLTHTEHEQLARALATLLEQRPDLADCRPEDAIR